MKLLLPILLLFSLGALSQESLLIDWPEKYQWKILSNTETEKIHVIEIIPGSEDSINWTMLGQMMSLKGVTGVSMSKAKDMMFEQTKTTSPKAKLTVVEENTSDKFPWILFKIESPNFTNSPDPESQLWYLRQGETSLYMNFIAVKEAKLSAAFVKEWSAVFKKSKVVRM